MKRQQSGFTLLELVLVLGIIMALLTGVIWYNNRMASIAKANAQSDTLRTLSNALNTYAVVYKTPLADQTPVSGVANSYAPTIAELKALGLLTTTFSPESLYGGGYAMRLELYPATCTPPACDLETLTSLTSPIIDPRTRRVDTSALGSAAGKIGGDAGYSSTAAPAVVSGVGGAWSKTNPQGSVAGILAIRGGYGSSGYAQFTRRDGSAPPTADWNMANVNVTGIAGLGSTTFNNSGTATIGGATELNSTLNVAGATTTRNITANGNVSITGMTTTRGITNTGNIDNSGDVITGRLSLETVVVNGSACPGLNGYQARTAAGSIASCINNIWTTPNAATAPPPPCTTRTVSWGSGCSGTISGAPSGSTGNVSASYGTGSATFVCSNGSWLFQSGTCTLPCTGTFSWGGGICSMSVGTMSSGTTRTLTMPSKSGPRGGTYTGTANVTCNNGSISVSGTPTCKYTNASPTVYNTRIPSQNDLQLAGNNTSVGSFCSMVLPGSTSTYTTYNQGKSPLWTCWGNVGYNCDIPQDGSNCDGTQVNGCSCWTFADWSSPPGMCVTAKNLVCTRNGL
ncbi:type II secretion system protein [Paracidovorax citrulli]